MEFFASQQTWAVLFCLDVFMLCALYKAWETYHDLNIDLKDVVSEMTALKFSYQKNGKKLTAKQMKYIESILMKKPYYSLSDADRKMVDFFKEQMMGTGQAAEILREDQLEEKSYYPVRAIH